MTVSMTMSMAAGRRDSGGRGRARQIPRQRRHGLRRRGSRRSECVLLLLLRCERRSARRCGRERWRRQEVGRGRGRAGDGRDGRDRVTVAVVVPVVVRRRLVVVMMVQGHGQLAVAARHSDAADTAARKRRRRESGGGRGCERVRRRKEHNVVVGIHRQQHEFGGLGQRQTQVALIARGVWRPRARAIRCVQ